MGPLGALLFSCWMPKLPWGLPVPAGALADAVVLATVVLSRLDGMLARMPVHEARNCWRFVKDWVTWVRLPVTLARQLAAYWRKMFFRAWCVRTMSGHWKM